ncbi:MAG: ABC transporter permease [Rubricoccaceae bacterium]
MLKSHALAALRSFRRQPGYAALNVVGLTVGFAAAFLILFAVQDELRKDQMHSDNLYMVLRNASFDEWATIQTWTAAPQPLAEVMRTEYPEVEMAAMHRYEGPQVLAVDEQQFWSDGYWVEPAFLEMFTFPLLAGDPATALEDPDGIVLTEALVAKLFGADVAPETAMGRSVRFNDATARVTGVAADLPSTSSMEFEWLMPAAELYSRSEWLMSWENNAMSLFVTLREDADIDALNQKMSDVLVERGNVEYSTAFVQRFSDRYLRSTYENGVQAGGGITAVRMFSLIAVLLLALAGINFTNLATARATRRAGEIGVRKTMGATRGSLMQQFLSESVLMALVAFGVAIALVVGFAGPLGDMLGKELVFGTVPLWIWGGFAAVAVGVGLFAGLYPAVVLSRFSPSKVIKGGQKGGLALRRGLVVFQFAASVVLIIGTLAMAAQLRYMQTRDIGLEREGLVTMALRDGAKSEFPAFRQALLDNPSIAAVGTANSSPLMIGSSTEDVEWDGKDPSNSASFSVMSVDTDAIDALGMTMADGRAFSSEMVADSSNYILNEAAVELMGLEAPVGEQIALWEDRGEVIGVVKDFHMRPMMGETGPTIFWLASPEDSYWATAFVRPAPGQTEQALAHLEATTAAFSPAYPFDYTFLDDEFDQIYQGPRQLGSLAGLFAGIAALIAGLGLVGLAAFAAEQRRKEVGVRRVLGASVAGVVALLSRDFLLWVALACVIAIPLASLIVDRLLGTFAYRVDLGLTPFALATLGALVIALLAAGSQALRAATADPIHALRSD